MLQVVIVLEDHVLIVVGLIKRLLNNPAHAQFLIHTDHHHAVDKKGFNLALLLKRVK